MAVQSAMPHQLLGFEIDDTRGILLSLEIIANASADQQRMQSTNKGKQSSRRSRMRSKNPNYSSQSRKK